MDLVTFFLFVTWMDRISKYDAGLDSLQFDNRVAYLLFTAGGFIEPWTVSNRYHYLLGVRHGGSRSLYVYHQSASFACIKLNTFLNMFGWRVGVTLCIWHKKPLWLYHQPISTRKRVNECMDEFVLFLPISGLCKFEFKAVLILKTLNW